MKRLWLCIVATLLFVPIVSHALTGRASARVDSTAGQQRAPDEQLLRDRVTKYWQARMQSNLIAAYPFYEPEFRAAYPVEQFVSSFQRLLRFRPQFQGIEGLRFEPDGRSAIVRVKLQTRPDALNGQVLDSVSEETWLLIDGVWYRQRESVMPSI